MHPTEALYRQRLREAAEMPPDQADYAALDQGEYGTNLRHAAVLDVVEGIHGGCMLDFGCGTGLLLDKMLERGLKPGWYFGVDGIEERRKPLLERVSRHEIKGSFTLKPMNLRFEELPFPYVDVCLAVGLCGYFGYHTLRQVRSLYEKMEKLAQHGAITFPMIYAHDQMGNFYLRRWDVSDILDCLRLTEKSVRVLEREFVVFW